MLARSAKGSKGCTRLVSRAEIERKSAKERKWKGKNTNERAHVEAEHDMEMRGRNEIHTTATKHGISEEKTRNTGAQKPEG